MNPAQELYKYGTSVWYDNISREILDNGELKRLISEWGVRGLTSNPTIFNLAFAKGNAYDAQIKSLASRGLSTEQLFMELAVSDIGRAADLLLPIYNESGGNDGFVSIEVSPLLAADTKGSIEEGLRLFGQLKRPNIMIKIPGTKEGIPAVRALLIEGVNVNITLLFSLENYTVVAKTYCEALEERVKRGLPIDRIRSVASFFVSRVDTEIDKRLQKIIKDDNSRAKAATSYLGKFGVANCRVVYERFKEIFEGNNFKALKEKGAVAQRPLWASTGVKNPSYRDVLYVEELIGPHTVNTMPHETLAAFVDHGKAVKETLHRDLAQAKSMAKELVELGVDVDGVLADLQVQGVKKFEESFVELNQTLKKKVA